MKSNVLSKTRNSMVYLTIFTLITALVLGFIPNKSLAADSSKEKEIPIESDLTKVDDIGFEILEMIKFTDTEVVYKTLEDNEVFLYEEYIDGDIVTTEVYKLENKSKELVKNFKTTTVLSGDNITVTHEDLLDSKNTSETTVEVLPAIKEEEVSINATNEWVTSSSGGNNYQYYLRTDGGGSAREINKQKSILYYNSNFNTFTKNVDSVASLEKGILKDLLYLGLLETGFKAVKDPTVATVTAFFKKYLKSIPVISVITSTVSYFNLINVAMRSYEAIPGTEVRWR